MSIVGLKPNQWIVQIAVDLPLKKLFDYLWDEATEPQMGQLVSVPFGTRRLPGIVIAKAKLSDYPIEKLKKVEAVAPLTCLGPELIRLAEFASQYYLKSLGEVLLPMLPAMVKDHRRWEKGFVERKQKKEATTKPENISPFVMPLNEEQKVVLNQLLSAGPKTHLLYGVTGGGKTLVYLHWIRELLSQDPRSQVLVMVPEINLTPQLENLFQQAFPQESIVVLNSALSEVQRGQAWLKAHRAQARIILGTRLSVSVSAPHLRAIIIDEEHDASYKQQEGVRYSARDLAIWRANDLKIPILLGSATPSLESWNNAKQGRFELLTIRHKAVPEAIQAHVEIIQPEKTKRVISNPVPDHALEQIRKTLDQGLQTLILINRRGYAPVLTCHSCSWISNCDACSSKMVIHKLKNRNVLCCHHCGLQKAIPRACPDCGNLDLSDLGSGTQKIEETLEEVFKDRKLIRIDADTTRLKGSAEELFNKVHDGSAEIIVGTQMISKGHDFKRVGLVLILNSDAALYTQDFRAPERLFSQIAQVSGRAGRTNLGTQAKILIVSQFPQDTVYQFAQQLDVEGFLNHLLEERQALGLPPTCYQALIHAEHKSYDRAAELLQEAAREAQQQRTWPRDLTLGDVVPRVMMKIAGKERAQLLLEAKSRPAMQQALNILDTCLQNQSNHKKGVAYYIDRDPLHI